MLVYPHWARFTLRLCPACTLEKVTCGQNRISLMLQCSASTDSTAIGKAVRYVLGDKRVLKWELHWKKAIKKSFKAKQREEDALKMSDPGNSWKLSLLSVLPKQTCANDTERYHITGSVYPPLVWHQPSILWSAVSRFLFILRKVRCRDICSTGISSSSKAVLNLKIHNIYNKSVRQMAINP